MKFQSSKMFGLLYANIAFSFLNGKYFINFSTCLWYTKIKKTRALSVLSVASPKEKHILLTTFFRVVWKTNFRRFSIFFCCYLRLGLNNRPILIPLVLFIVVSFCNFALPLIWFVLKKKEAVQCTNELERSKV